MLNVYFNRSNYRVLFTVIGFLVITVIGGLFFCPNALAAEKTQATVNNDPSPTSKNVKPKASIIGNPIGGHDIYTINSDKAQQVELKCVFTNTNAKATQVILLTTPQKTTVPPKTIKLEAGSLTKPFQLDIRLLFTLKQNWWCDLFARQAKQSSHWKYCAYFAVIDPNISRYNPFLSSSDARNKDVSYTCRIQNPKPNIRFFHLKANPNVET